MCGHSVLLDMQTEIQKNCPLPEVTALEAAESGAECWGYCPHPVHFTPYLPPYLETLRLWPVFFSFCLVPPGLSAQAPDKSEVTCMLI